MDRRTAIVAAAPVLAGAALLPGKLAAFPTGSASPPKRELCVDTMDDLRNLAGGVVSCLTLLGYYAKGDGGGGDFYWDSASTESDNGGTVIAPPHPATGRWKRLISGPISVKWFGARGDGKVITDASIDIAHLGVLKSPSEANFALTDEKKTVYILAAGGPNIAFRGTIDRRIDSKSVMLDRDVLVAPPYPPVKAIYGHDDTDAFQRAIDAVSDLEVVQVPSSGGFYFFALNSDPSGPPAITISKNITIQGDSPNVTIKMGPEQPNPLAPPPAPPATPVAPGTFAYRMFLINNGFTVRFRNVNLEGPEANAKHLFRIIHAGPVPILPGGTATVICQNVKSSKGGEFLKFDEAYSSGDKVAIIEDCDLDNLNDGTAPPYPLILSLSKAWLKISRSKLQNHANCYCVYRGWSCSLSLQDCDIGPGTNGTSNYLVYAQGPPGDTTAPDFDLVSNCRFDGTGVVAGSLLTNKYAVEEVTNCTFYNNHYAILMRGSALISNCYLNGGMILNEDDIRSGSIVSLSNCRFDNCEFATGNSGNDKHSGIGVPFTVAINGCIFTYTPGPNTPVAELMTFNTSPKIEPNPADPTEPGAPATPLLTVFVSDSTFIGGPNSQDSGKPNSQVRIGVALDLRFEKCKFYNNGTTAFSLVQPDNLTNFRIDECWFQDFTKAYSFAGIRAGYKKREIHLRNGMNPDFTKSDDAIVLDQNFNAFRVTGCAPITKISIQDSNYTGHPTWDLDDEITLFVEAEQPQTVTCQPLEGFELVTSINGNILAAGGRRLVGRAVKLRFNGSLSPPKWVEVT